MTDVKRICPFPVSAILHLADGTDPNVLYPGTVWQAINDVFLVAAGSNFSVGTTGGAASHTLTADELPSHKHTVGAHAHGLNSHTHTVGAHSHGLNGHTHTYAKANATSGSTTLTIDQIPSHNHTLSARDHYNEDTSAEINSWYYGHHSQLKTSYTTSNAGGGKGHTHTIGTTSTNTGGNSGSTADSSQFNTGQASGNTANSAAFDSGATGGVGVLNAAALSRRGHLETRVLGGVRHDAAA